VLEIAAEAPAGARVRVCIRPEDVTLTVADGARSRPSARNALEGTCDTREPSTHATHVLVDVGFRSVAAVTARSVSRLGLRPGARVRAVFKASAAHLMPYDAPGRGRLDSLPTGDIRKAPETRVNTWTGVGIDDEQDEPAATPPLALFVLRRRSLPDAEGGPA